MIVNYFKGWKIDCLLYNDQEDYSIWDWIKLNIFRLLGKSKLELSIVVI